MQDMMQKQDISCAKVLLNLRGILQVFLDSALPSSGDAEFFFFRKKKTPKNQTSKTSGLIS